MLDDLSLLSLSFSSVTIIAHCASTLTDFCHNSTQVVGEIEESRGKRDTGTDIAQLLVKGHTGESEGKRGPDKASERPFRCLFEGHFNGTEFS